MFEDEGPGVLAGKFDDNWIGVTLLGWDGEGLVDGVLQNRVVGRGQVSSSLRTGHDREDNLSENDFRNRCRGVAASIGSPTIRREEALASWSSRLTCSVSLAMVSSLLMMSFLAAANSSRTTVFSTRSSCSDFSRLSILPHSCPMLAVRAASWASMVE